MTRPSLSQFATVSEYKAAYAAWANPLNTPARALRQAHLDHCVRARVQGFLPLPLQAFVATLHRVLH